MSDVYLWLIPVLPLLGSLAAALFGPRWLKGQSHWPVIACAAGACVFSVLTLFAVAREAQPIANYYTWFSAGDVTVGFRLHADALTAVMLCVVTFIGSLIAIYSIGYMHHDPGYPRFFAEIGLFLFAMTGLVLADNFILLYAFWEGVGLCSYLLIGFWYAKPSAAAAARKAFLVTRLGDIGLFLGILTLWVMSRFSLNFEDVFEHAAENASGGNTFLLSMACFLLFVGAIGKSAQFPLHVWLPDAMEGPSPVSALIHAATMVTAGVYLLARCTPLFALAPDVQIIVACIGTFTAFLGALMALTQTDLKRVLAYSTISQLGYMFLGLGCGLRSQELVILGVTAAVFHLVTHAFFKALLFLAAGSVMHAMGDVIDMRKFSGLRKVMPITHWTFLCGAGALSGFPILFSGFWSKDEILAAAFSARQDTAHGGLYLVLFVVGLVTAGLTAFYTARAYFLTFWGELKTPPEAGEHVHDAPAVMAWPLMILAVGAVGVGIVLGPTHLFGHFLEANWMKVSPAMARIMNPAEAHFNLGLMVLSSLVALAGIGLAAILYLKSPAQASVWSRRLGFFYELSRNKFYLDELYYAFIVRPLESLAWLMRVFDQYIVDGLVDMIGQMPRIGGVVLRPLQNGLVQFYGLFMALGLAGFLVMMLMR